MRGPDLRARSAEAELMEAPAVDAATVAACLRDLAAVNRLTLAHGPTLGWLARALRGLRPGEGFSLLDVACGGGDLLRAVAAWAARRGLRARLAGVDRDPRCLAAARAATPAALGVALHEADVFAFRPPEPPDLVVSSLFTHHLSDDEVVRFLRWMEATARRGWLVNDLERHAVALHGFGLLARAMRWHPVVRHDGMVSVARGFRPGEWRALLARAGVPGEAWRVAPFRLCVGRLRG